MPARDILHDRRRLDEALKVERDRVRGATARMATGRLPKAIRALRGAPCIILVRPYLDENVGSVARAMANFGLTELRLVAPQPTCNWLSDSG